VIGLHFAAGPPLKFPQQRLPNKSRRWPRGWSPSESSTRLPRFLTNQTNTAKRSLLPPSGRRTRLRHPKRSGVRKGQPRNMGTCTDLQGRRRHSFKWLRSTAVKNPGAQLRRQRACSWNPTPCNKSAWGRRPTDPKTKTFRPNPHSSPKGQANPQAARNGLASHHSARLAVEHHRLCQQEHYTRAAPQTCGTDITVP
jgi:hypothetical protein